MENLTIIWVCNTFHMSTSILSSFILQSNEGTIASISYSYRIPGKYASLYNSSSKATIVTYVYPSVAHRSNNCLPFSYIYSIWVAIISICFSEKAASMSEGSSSGFLGQMGKGGQYSASDYL